AIMEFTLLFLATAIVMLVAWRGSRRLLGLFAAVPIACAPRHRCAETVVLRCP
ncbi:MAG: hypothetical protein JWL86_6254, partial [Rhizobium sp.]|nr:hypothetical protein [Rhizobium sp.]